MKINLILISIACAVLFEVAKANEEEQDGAFRMVDDLTKADYLANWAMRELPAKYSPFSVMNVLNIQIQETRDGHSRYKFDAELLIGHGVGDYNRDVIKFRS